MILRSILVFGILFLSIIGISQENNEEWKSFPTSNDTVTVGKEGILTDHKIIIQENNYNNTLIGTGSAALNTPIEIQELNEAYTEKSKNLPKIKGYTILLFSGSGANSKLYARNTLMEFEQVYPSCETHLAWRSPNYEVRVGNFRTKLEAEKLLHVIQKDFPTAFIKTAMIELPAIDKVEMPNIEEE